MLRFMYILTACIIFIAACSSNDDRLQVTGISGTEVVEIEYNVPVNLTVTVWRGDKRVSNIPVHIDFDDSLFVLNTDDIITGEDGRAQFTAKAVTQEPYELTQTVKVTAVGVPERKNGQGSPRPINLEKTYTIKIKALGNVADYSEVTFNSNGGSPVNHVYVLPGSYITKPNDPTREGYSFDGWFKDSALTTPWDFSVDKVLYTDITLYAKWHQIVTYTVTFDSTGGSSVASLTVVENSKITAPEDPVLPGQDFIGWYKDSQFINKWIFSEDYVNANITLYAAWAVTIPNRNIVIFDWQNGGDKTLLRNVEPGSLITAPDSISRASFNLEGWYKDETLTERWDFAVDRVYTSKTLYANWVPVKRTIVFMSGLVPVAYSTVNDGDVASAPDVSKEGYVLVQWCTDRQLNEFWDFRTPVTSNMLLYAKWQQVSGWKMITNEQELREVANDLSADYQVGNDFTINSSNWTPLGSDSNPFTGTLDGNNFTISGLEITNVSGTNMGLFGVIQGDGSYNSGLVENLKLDNVNIIAGTKAGAVAGEVRQGNLNNVCVSGTQVRGDDNIGGLVGYINGTNSSITNSATNITVQAVKFSGGITAYLNGGLVESSYSKGNVIGGPAGGVVGLFNIGTVSNVYSKGNITGAGGGIIGYMNSGTLENAYATGNGTSSSFNGIVGESNIGVIRNVFALNNAGNIKGNGSASVTGSYYLSGNNLAPAGNLQTLMGNFPQEIWDTDFNRSAVYALPILRNACGEQLSEATPAHVLPLLQ